jgi:ABC-type transport system involved in multi-copper enzyme maturation permease subunit
MSWLIWKDYRLNRAIVIMTVVLLIGAHMAAVAVAFYESSVPEGSRLLGYLTESSIESLVFLQLMLGVLGGNLIACERANRSAEFLAYLPISRGRILASKILLAIGLFAVIWIPNLAILATARLMMDDFRAPTSF